MICSVEKRRYLAWLEDLRKRILVVFPGVGPRRCDHPPGDEATTSCGAIQSIKGSLLPIEEIGGHVRAEEGRMLVWGARPCEMKAVSLLDAVFMGGLPDPAYARRRKKMVFCAFVCTERSPLSYCSRMGVDRTRAEGADIECLEVDEQILLRSCTKAGEEVLAEGDEFLREVGGDLLSKAMGLLEEARRSDAAAPNPAAVDVAAFAARAEEVAQNETAFTWIADSCLGCGICSFVCPTCWCFDIKDASYRVMEEIRGSGGSAAVSAPTTAAAAVRFRSWDSCQIQGYGKMAGGADPLALPIERVRHRFLHKMAYIPKTYGRLGCIGCGKCLTACPAGVGMKAQVELFLEF